MLKVHKISCNHKFVLFPIEVQEKNKKVIEFWHNLD